MSVTIKNIRTLETRQKFFLPDKVCKIPRKIHKNTHKSSMCSDMLQFGRPYFATPFGRPCPFAISSVTIWSFFRVFFYSIFRSSREGKIVDASVKEYRNIYVCDLKVWVGIWDRSYRSEYELILLITKWWISDCQFNRAHFFYKSSNLDRNEAVLENNDSIYRREGSYWAQLLAMKLNMVHF